MSTPISRADGSGIRVEYPGGFIGSRPFVGFLTYEEAYAHATGLMQLCQEREITVPLPRAEEGA